jgi:hypothetical protein
VASCIVDARLFEDSLIHFCTSVGRSGLRCRLFCWIHRFKFAKSFLVSFSNRFTISLNSIFNLFFSMLFSKFAASFSNASQISFLSLFSNLVHFNRSLIFLSSLFASSTVIFFSDRFS